MGRPKGSTQVTTPLKCQISREFNLRGGVGTHGAAVATAEEFGLSKTSGPSQVIKYDAQVRDGSASRSNRPHTGRKSDYDSLKSCGEVRGYGAPLGKRKFGLPLLKANCAANC